MEPAKRSLHAVAFDLPLALLLVVILAGALSGPSMADQVLSPGGSLTTGQSLSVGSYVLTMQSDCNLVLYNGRSAVWSSGTNGRGSSCSVTMQRDGNLVVYTGTDSAVWGSGTTRAIGNYALVLQRDSNLVIYGSSIWATGTNNTGVKAAAAAAIPKDAVLPASDHAGVLGGRRKATTYPAGALASNND